MLNSLDSERAATRCLRVLAVLLALFVLPVGPISAATQATHSPASYLTAPPAGVIGVVEAYLAAREDAIGADRASEFAWLKAVRGISTSTWFAHLQPPQSCSTNCGPFPGEYNEAHSNGWRVDVAVTGCGWQGGATKGAAFCSLTDLVVTVLGHKTVPKAALPFGWVHVGHVLPALVKLVLIGGHWKVAGVIPEW